MERFILKIVMNSLEFYYDYSNPNNRDQAARAFEVYPGTYRVTKYTVIVYVSESE